MQLKFFEKTGKVALGTRLRLMTRRITEDAHKIYELYDVDFSPKWFPVFFVLQTEQKTITEIAAEIGHSQPSVSKIVQEMILAGYVQQCATTQDKRQTQVELTSKGGALSEKISQQCIDVDEAIGGLISEARNNLWEAIEEWEFLLDQKSLLRRVQERKKLRESKDVQIVDYENKYQKAFRSLNEEWISHYFEMEEADYKALDHPKEYILDKGGKIFVALYEGEPVGVCALIKMNDPEYDFEFAKMAVSPSLRGRNIGWLLGQAVVNAAKELNGSNLYLESNTVLEPAIKLYYKLGFKRIVGRSTPYKRCNIQMNLNLKEGQQ